MLHDPYVNTLMAARYLEELIENHGELPLVLAEYNGGPHNAAYFESGSAQLADETRQYVPKVMGHYERILEDVTTYQDRVPNGSRSRVRVDEARLETATSSHPLSDAELSQSPTASCWSTTWGGQHQSGAKGSMWRYTTDRKRYP
jgi:hypothetical protein